MGTKVHSTISSNADLHQPHAYGPFADRPSTPSQGDWYFCSDEVFDLRCVTAGIWEPHVWMPSHYYREDDWQIKGYSVAADRYTLQTPTRIGVTVGLKMMSETARANLDLSNSSSWDTTAGTDYTVAANRAGVDFYVYAVDTGTGTAAEFIVSANSSVPSGYTASTSRKVGGFHCLCVSVGAIGGHTLTGFVQGDILPQSVWDLEHRPFCDPEGMVWSPEAQLWVDIYLQSGTGSSTASAYGGTPEEGRTWYNHRDDGVAVGKRMLYSWEFTIIAEGSNEETAAAGPPTTTGGNSDTGGQRMISDIGCEDCCGWIAQFLDMFNRNVPGGAYVGTYNWYDLATSKGSLYFQGTNGDDAPWTSGRTGTAARCGSMCKDFDSGIRRDEDGHTLRTCRFACAIK